MSDIRHIVFDIGRVLIHYDPEIPYRRLIPDDAQRRWFLENVCTGDWNIEQDRGRRWEDAEALLIAEHPQEEENIRASAGTGTKWCLTPTTIRSPCSKRSSTPAMT